MRTIRERGYEGPVEVTVYDASDYLTRQDMEIHALREENAALMENRGGGVGLGFFAFLGTATYFSGLCLKAGDTLEIKDLIVGLLEISSCTELEEKGLKEEVVKEYQPLIKKYIKKLEDLEKRVDDIGSFRYAFGQLFNGKSREIGSDLKLLSIEIEALILAMEDKSKKK